MMTNGTLRENLTKLVCMDAEQRSDQESLNAVDVVVKPKSILYLYVGSLLGFSGYTVCLFDLY